MSVPAYSVVIPTHNRAQKLVRAIGSALGQSFHDFEVVIVDDGSRDATRARLAELDDVRCRCVRNEIAGGVSAARNRGAGEARGRFIVFLDDDDALRPDALALLDAKLRSVPRAEFAWGGRHVSQSDRQGRHVGTRDDIWTTGDAGVRGTAFLAYAVDIAASCAFTIRRETFLAMQGFDTSLRISEDREFFVRLAELGLTGCSVAEPVVDIDEHFVDSLSRNLAAGPQCDLAIMERHRSYLDRPENAGFMEEYYLRVLAGFLLAGNGAGSRGVLRELRRRGALDQRALRVYLRHASGFRKLKSLLRYDSIRRLRHRHGR